MLRYLRRRRGVRLNADALRAAAKGQPELAERLYRAAAAADPTYASPWYNLGLEWKYAGRWDDSLAANAEALRRDPENVDAAWNLGIAATATGRWAEARAAWRAAGIDVPPGDGPLEMNLGLTPVRLEPDGAAEVVWCHRICPARAVIASVPLPTSGLRWGDTVLHDGAANGWRKLQGQDVPVFDALTVLARSSVETFEVGVEAPEPEDVLALEELAVGAGMVAEDWSGVRALCKACSEGHPDDAEHSHAPEEWSPERRVGLVAPDEDAAKALLEKWERDGAGRAWRIDGAVSRRWTT